MLRGPPVENRRSKTSSNDVVTLTHGSQIKMSLRARLLRNVFNCGPRIAHNKFLRATFFYLNRLITCHDKPRNACLKNLFGKSILNLSKILDAHLIILTVLLTKKH